ncbi:MAG TPA: DUF1028 domain-containing protein [Gemmatimonadales bacterium]|jgi:uncharacterized Ntn-hydrolase superfamily protein
MRNPLPIAFVILAGAAAPLGAQEPVSWGAGDPAFHTFSIAAVDTLTGEVGVAVTTRVACVGNGVPWVRAGVGAVATQASTRVAYGGELLDMLAAGTSAAAALRTAVAADDRSAWRQVGVIGLHGGNAQHTGDSTSAWAGHRAGATYVTQGNLLVGPEVIDAVAEEFEASDGELRHLVDRLIDALAAGQAAGGDARKGRVQSAAVVVADSRPGVSRRPDGITVNINVCEHPTPVAELRRIHDVISQTLGYRPLHEFSGRDVWQLKVMLHALGLYRSDVDSLAPTADEFRYDSAAMTAVDAFRESIGLSTPALGSPSGLVDRTTIDGLWDALERRGLADDVRRRLLRWTQISR